MKSRTITAITTITVISIIKKNLNISTRASQLLILLSKNSTMVITDTNLTTMEHPGITTLTTNNLSTKKKETPPKSTMSTI